MLVKWRVENVAINKVMSGRAAEEEAEGRVAAHVRVGPPFP
jgi:hypothetical protein